MIIYNFIDPFIIDISKNPDERVIIYKSDINCLVVYDILSCFAEGIDRYYDEVSKDDEIPHKHALISITNAGAMIRMNDIDKYSVLKGIYEVKKTISDQIHCDMRRIIGKNKTSYLQYLDFIVLQVHSGAVYKN